MKLVIKNKLPAIVREDGAVILENMYVGTRYWGTMYNLLKDYRPKEWQVRECDKFGSEKDFSPLGDAKYYIAECDSALIYAALGKDKALIRTEYTNIGENKDVNDLITLGGLWKSRLERAMTNTYTAYNGVKCLDMNARTRNHIFDENGFCESAVHMPLIDRDGQCFNIGFVSYEEMFSGTFACEGGTLEFRQFINGGKAEAGQTMHSDWMLISLFDDMNDGLCDYTKFIHDFNRFVDRRTKIPAGFCTWYYYMGNINERSVYENLDTIEKIKDKVPLEYFQIDAGWCKSDTRDDTNLERFPLNMDGYAKLITEKGLKPGLWLSPFDYSIDGELYSEHPDWFVKKFDSDEPVLVKGKTVILDVTNPEVQEYVKALYRKITYDWGYRYLKLDMVSDFLVFGRYHKNGAGPIHCLREFFRCVREASHPDTFILSCTSPMFEIAEYVDASRVSVDIFERWESLVKQFHLSLKRFYMHKNLFICDPDCLMIRKSENEDDDCRRFCTRTDEEILTYMRAAYCCGGIFMISDKLPLMNGKQIDMYSKFFPLNERAAKPLDLMSAFIPSLLDLGYEGGTRTVGFFNWGERETTLTLELDGVHTAKEHFTDEVYDATDKFTITLAPHCSALVKFTKA